jgi:hypothetical protein
MTQTVGAMSTVDADIDVSADGSTWVSLAGSANQVEVPAQTRMTGTGYTFDGDVAIVTQGKREPLEVTVSGLYTEEAAELFETIRPWFQSGARCYFRYSPKGVGATGRAVYTASNDGATAGPVSISQLKYPDIVAGEADPAPGSFTLMVPAFVRTTTGNSTGLGSS